MLLDEIQIVEDFESVLNGFLHIDNLDIYVTGSNSRFLSSDIITEFRGRGDEIRVFPLSFSEFYSAFEGDKLAAWDEYIIYGGLPKIVSFDSEMEKAQYLKQLFEKTYLSDITERNNVQRVDILDSILNVLASSIGSLTAIQQEVPDLYRWGMNCEKGSLDFLFDTYYNNFNRRNV